MVRSGNKHDHMARDGDRSKRRSDSRDRRRDSDTCAFTANGDEVSCI